MTRVRRLRRGISIIEVFLAATFMLAILTVMLGFLRFSERGWRDGMNHGAVTLAAEMGLQRISAEIRQCRRVVTGSSSTTVLTLQMPDYDGSGNLITPLADGDLLSFYLSDTTGSTAASGNILWKSVNGTPDSTWSLQDGKGRVLVASGGLTFGYVPSLAVSGGPESVTVSLTTTSTVSTSTRTVTMNQEAAIRNYGL